MDSGAKWNALNTGLTVTDVYALAINSSGQLFAGTNGGGVFRSVATTPVEEHADDLPTSYSLEQNYPNPFNPSTAISFQLSAVSLVKLEVFDVLGRKVATLVDGLQPAGSYTVRWDAANQSSGVYIYRLKARPIDGGSHARDGEFVQSRKMILVR
jgi:hypothetical protein